MIGLATLFFPLCVCCEHLLGWIIDPCSMYIFLKTAVKYPSDKNLIFFQRIRSTWLDDITEEQNFDLMVFRSAVKVVASPHLQETMLLHKLYCDKHMRNYFCRWKCWIPHKKEDLQCFFFYSVILSEWKWIIIDTNFCVVWNENDVHESFNYINRLLFFL